MKRNNAKRVLALALASAMLLQQGSVGIFAAETETVTEAQTEQTTEAKVEETQAPATEAPAPETKAEETQAPATEAPAEETKAEETQAPATEATEAPTEETKIEETQAPTTEAPTGETKIEETQAPATEAPGEGTETEETQAPATEAPAETATEAPTEAVTEAPTEKETETESETEEAVVLDTVITQEVFQKTVEDTVQPMVKYTVKVANKAKTADTEDVSVKVLLAKALSYSREDGETAELGVYKKLEDAVNADVFEDIKLDDAVKDAYTEGGVVLWKDQKIAAGEEKEFVFFAAVEDGVADTEALRNLWFVNDEEITGNGKIEWLNTDLLKVEKELPTEFIYDDGNMVVTATLSDGAILPEGAQFVVTEKTLSEEEAALIEESLGEEQTMTGYVAYDMHFEVDGKEVEPKNGTVSVSVSYEKAQTLAPVNEGEEAVPEDGEVKMLHITDEQTVEDVTTDVDVKKNGKVREVGFTTDGFSTFVLMSSNEIMPIVDENPEIFVENVKIGTKEYTHLTKVEASSIYNGKVEKNSAETPFIAYVGEEIEVSAQVPGQGYSLEVGTGNLSKNSVISTREENLSAKFTVVGTGDASIVLKKGTDIIDQLFVKIHNPIKVTTALGERHIDMVHEHLDGPYVANPTYIYAPDGIKKLYIRNTESQRYVAYDEDEIILSAIGTSETSFVPNSTTLIPKVDEIGSTDVEGGLKKKIVKIQVNNDLSNSTIPTEIKFGDTTFYIAIRNDEQTSNHFDIEVADGGVYTVILTQNNPDGTKTTITTEYETYVSMVNKCVVKGASGNILCTLDSSDYHTNGDPGSAQYELTSAYRLDENGNYLREDGTITDNPVEAVISRPVMRVEVNSVEFDLEVFLKPVSQTIEKNGTKTEVVNIPTDDIRVSGIKLEMGKQEIQDAFNKCPDHSGLDFTISQNVREKIQFALVQLQANKELKGGTLEAEQFEFELYDESGNKLDTKKNDGNGIVIFDEIGYDKDQIGTKDEPRQYKYYIKEKKGIDNDIVYDTREVEAIVEVYYDNTEGTHVNVTYSYKDSAGAFSSDPPTFVNVKPNPEKTEVAPGDRKMVHVGDIITYNITWKNYQDKAADVTITDTLDPGVDHESGGSYDSATHTVTWTLKNQPAGESGSVELKVKVNEKAFEAYKYGEGDTPGKDDKLTESGADKDFEVWNRAGVQVGNDPKVLTDVVENPVPKKEEVTPGDRKLVGVGDEITYEIFWKNGHKEPAEVTITDKLDPGVTFKGASNDGECMNGVVTWKLGTQDAGAQGSVKLTVTVNENAYKTYQYGAGTEPGKDDVPTPGEGEDYEVLNRATVQVGNNSAVTDIVENPVPKKDEKTPGDRVMVKVGDKITYQIHWKNGYDAPATVTITDKLDPGVKFVNEGDGHYDSASHTVTWTIKAAGNETGMVTLTVEVTEKAFEKWEYNDDATDFTGSADEKDFEVWNQARVKINDDNEVKTEKVENPVPKKEETVPGDRVMVGVGENITYRIYWKNGHKENTDVTITDYLDPGVTFVSADNGGTCKDGVVTWKLANRPGDGKPGSSGYVELTVKVTEKAYENWVYPNEDGALVAGPTSEKDYEVWNRAAVQVGSDPKVKTEIVENPVPEKMEPTPGDRVMVNVGDPITYEIGWKNGHKETAKVTVTDPLDPGVTYVSSEPEGKYDEETHTVTWSFDAEGEAKGTIELNVTVNENAFKDWKYGKEDDPIINADEKVKDYEVWNRAKVQIDDDSQYTVVVENPVPEKTEQTPGDRVMVNVGDPITYEIGWKNGHKETAKVTVTDPLDPGVTYVSSEPEGKYDEETHTVTWSFDAEGEAKGTIKLNVTVNENAFKDWKYGEEDDPIINADEKVKDYEVWNRAKVQVGNDSVYTDIVENPVPEKTEVTPGKGVMVEIGQDITYEIHWKNGHDEPATVTVTDKLDPGVTFKSADNGGTCKDGVVTWTLDAAAAGKAGSEGSVKLTVTVNENAYDTWQYGSGDKPTAGDGKDYEVLNRAVVQVGHDPKVLTNIIPNPVPEKDEVTPGKGVMTEVGKDITYEIHWKNGHDEPVTVTVTDKLDPGVTFKSADNNGTCKDGVVTWTLNAAAGEAGSVKLTVTVNENAYDTWQYGSGDKPTAGDGKDYEVLNRAAVQVGHDPKVLTNVIPNPVPEKTEVTPGKGVMVGIGQDITYEIHWKNGHDEPATVTVTDKLDPGVTFKSADNGGTCKDGVVTWTLNAAAAGEAGSEGSVKLTVTVNENAYKTYTYGDSDTPTAGDGKDYEVLNRAGVQVGHDPKVLTNIIPNPVPEKEETDPGANETVYVGDQITYEIHWKNGHDTAADVTVTDPLDEGLDFVSADQGGSYDSATRTVTWVIKNVAAGQSGKVTLVAKVNVNARKDDYIVENQAGVQVGNDPKVLTQIIPNPTPEEPRDGTIRVTKELTALGEDLYAADETFYVALFADEACTKRVTDIKALEFKNASSSTVTFKDIDIGRTYYVGEVNADGEVILAGLAEDGTIFTANFNEGKSAVVKNADGSTTVVFENTFENIPDGFYRSGKLNITKKLLGVDGKAMDSDETFYAGIFADAEHTELSGDVSENIVELSLSGGSSVSASVDVVCDPEGPTTLYVTEVTEDGRPVGMSFGYTVTVDNGEVSLDVDHTSADVTITNQLKEEPESESEEPTKSVKTGDDTPLMGYVLLMLAALAMAIVTEAMRRRRKIER